MTTIRDIAKAAGISIGTVSRALKNQPGLTEETRRAVVKVAQDLGYDFGKLKQGKIRRLAFLLHRQHNTLASSPFFSPVLHGVEEACRKEGIVLSFMAVGPADPVLEQIRLHEPDALLCAGFFEPELLSALRDTGKPLVLIDMRVPGFTSVNPDNLLGGYLATRHLLDNGRQRIAFVSGSLAHYSIRERGRGFRKALFEAKMLADPELEIIIPNVVDPEQGIWDAIQALLAMPQRPDALLCYNDSTALVAMRCCLDAGLKIPQDIAIVGFDDIAAAALAHPPLTTVHIDKEALGATGVALLMQGQSNEALEKILPVELVVRESAPFRPLPTPANHA